MRRRRVGDVDAQHETVELRFGQRVGALELVRVLRREDDEPVGQRQPLALHRHLALFHRLEQRRLRLRAGAVHLVHQQDVREHRPRVEHELLLARVEDVHADDVARHQVRRALDALEAAAEAARERFRDQRLAEARRALQQDVAARETGREEPVYHAVRAVDDAADLAVEVEFEVLQRCAHASCFRMCCRRLCRSTRLMRLPSSTRAYSASRRSISSRGIAPKPRIQAHSGRPSCGSPRARRQSLKKLAKRRRAAPLLADHAREEIAGRVDEAALAHRRRPRRGRRQARAAEHPDEPERNDPPEARVQPRIAEERVRVVNAGRTLVHVVEDHVPVAPELRGDDVRDEVRVVRLRQHLVGEDAAVAAHDDGAAADPGDPERAEAAFGVRHQGQRRLVLGRVQVELARLVFRYRVHGEHAARQRMIRDRLQDAALRLLERHENIGSRPGGRFIRFLCSGRRFPAVRLAVRLLSASPSSASAASWISIHRSVSW